VSAERGRIGYRGGPWDEKRAPHGTLPVRVAAEGGSYLLSVDGTVMFYQWEPRGTLEA
jgi:hypothetical protein